MLRRFVTYVILPLAGVLALAQSVTAWQDSAWLRFAVATTAFAGMVMALTGEGLNSYLRTRSSRRR
jgi:hypothetical protein